MKANAMIRLALIPALCLGAVHANMYLDDFVCDNRKTGMMMLTQLFDVQRGQDFSAVCNQPQLTFNMVPSTSGLDVKIWLSSYSPFPLDRSLPSDMKGFTELLDPTDESVLSNETKTLNLSSIVIPEAAACGHAYLVATLSRDNELVDFVHTKLNIACAANPNFDLVLTANCTNSGGNMSIDQGVDLGSLGCVANLGLINGDVETFTSLSRPAVIVGIYDHLDTLMAYDASTDKEAFLRSMAKDISESSDLDLAEAIVMYTDLAHSKGLYRSEDIANGAVTIDQDGIQLDLSMASIPMVKYETKMMYNSSMGRNMSVSCGPGFLVFMADPFNELDDANMTNNVVVLALNRSCDMAKEPVCQVSSSALEMGQKALIANNTNATMFVGEYYGMNTFHMVNQSKALKWRLGDIMADMWTQELLEDNACQVLHDILQDKQMGDSLLQSITKVLTSMVDDVEAVNMEEELEDAKQLLTLLVSTKADILAAIEGSDQYEQLFYQMFMNNNEDENQPDPLYPPDEMYPYPPPPNRNESFYNETSYHFNTFSKGPKAFSSKGSQSQDKTFLSSMLNMFSGKDMMSSNNRPSMTAFSSSNDQNGDKSQCLSNQLSKCAMASLWSPSTSATASGLCSMLSAETRTNLATLLSMMVRGKGGFMALADPRLTSRLEMELSMAMEKVKPRFITPFELEDTQYLMMTMANAINNTLDYVQAMDNETDLSLLQVLNEVLNSTSVSTQNRMTTLIKRIQMTIVMNGGDLGLRAGQIYEDPSASEICNLYLNRELGDFYLRTVNDGEFDEDHGMLIDAVNNDNDLCSSKSKLMVPKSTLFPLGMTTIWREMEGKVMMGNHVGLMDKWVFEQIAVCKCKHCYTVPPMYNTGW